jgi:3-oxoacyl-[acyl-carrier protein] reductase
MQFDLCGQVALVTGSSQGIGRSIGIGLAEAGVKVVLTARNQKKLEAVQEEIASRGGEAEVLQADISMEEDILHLFDKLEERYGKLDILVNNAGIGIWGKLVDFAMDDFDRLMAVNVRGLYLCCQQAMRMMIPRKKGFIINVSSVVGFKGYPNQSAYTASKHAVMGITKSLAVEAQEHNICVSVILPGGVDTDFIGEARPDLDRSILIPPEDIARCVLFLLSLSDRAMVDQIYIRRRTGSPF